MKNPKSFSIISSYLLLENRFKIKLLMNFEPVLKRAVVCFFDPCATVYSRKSWGVLGTNLVSSAHVQGGKTFCASFCASFIAGSRRAFLRVCVRQFVCLSLREF